MRILYSTFTYPPSRNGVSLSSANDVELLRDLGHEVDVVTGVAVQGDAAPDPRIHRFAMKGNGSPWNPVRGDKAGLAAFLAGGHWDIAVLGGWQNWATDAVAPLLRTLQPRVKMLLRSHGISVNTLSSGPVRSATRYVGWRPYLWWRIPQHLSSVTALLALADQQDNDRFLDVTLARRHNLPVHVIPNVAPSWFASRGRVTAPPEHQSTMGYFLCVGAFTRQKNERMVLDAYELSAVHDASLVFVGPTANAYAGALHRRCARRGLSCSFVFDPSESTLANLYGNALAVVSGSRTECQPLALLDAIQQGVPFIATPVGSVPSIEGGLLAKNACEMAAAMLRISSDKDLRTALSEQGRVFARQRHSPTIVRQRWADVLSTA